MSPKNERLTAKDRGLIKGALRRAFSRSKLRQEVLEASIVKHTDSTRPKVKNWCLCASCYKAEAKSYVVVDHIDPMIPITTNFEDMTLDTAVDRLWCEKANLQVLCKVCHEVKTAQERKERAKHKKESKKV